MKNVQTALSRKFRTSIIRRRILLDVQCILWQYPRRRENTIGREKRVMIEYHMPPGIASQVLENNSRAF